MEKGQMCTPKYFIFLLLTTKRRISLKFIGLGMLHNNQKVQCVTRNPRVRFARHVSKFAKSSSQYLHY